MGGGTQSSKVSNFMRAVGNTGSAVDYTVINHGGCPRNRKQEGHTEGIRRNEKKKKNQKLGNNKPSRAKRKKKCCKNYSEYISHKPLRRSNAIKYK